MKSACVLAALALLAIGSFALSIPDEMLTWQTDWARAQRIAQRDGKPIFAVLVCKH